MEDEHWEVKCHASTLCQNPYVRADTLENTIMVALLKEAEGRHFSHVIHIYGICFGGLGIQWVPHLPGSLHPAITCELCVALNYLLLKMSNRERVLLKGELIIGFCSHSKKRFSQQA